MRLSLRLMLSMGAVALLAVGIMAAVSVQRIESAVAPRAFDRYQQQATLAAATFGASVRSPGPDLLGFRSLIGLADLIRLASSIGIDDPAARDWRQRIAARLAEELRAKPHMAKFRIIGAADGGREIVRVDRFGPNGSVRIVEENELQTKEERDFFRRALALPDGEIDVSVIDLNQEHGAIQTPHLPNFRVGTPLFQPDGQPFGVMVINVDVRPAFAALAGMKSDGVTRYLVNEQGDYLLHADPAKTFGFEFGRPERAQGLFPDLALVLATRSFHAGLMKDGNGEAQVVSVAWVREPFVPSVAIVDVVPYSTAFGSIVAVRDSLLLATTLALLAAIALSVMLARSLSLPLERIAAAIAAFGRGETVPLPEAAGGEVGELARSFTAMRRSVTEKAEAVRRNEQLLDRVLENIADGVLVVDAEGRTLFSNRAQRNWFPRFDAPFDATAQANFKRLLPDGVTPMPDADSTAARINRNEDFDNVEFVALYPGEETGRHLSASGRILRGPSGEREGAVVIYRDLSAMKDVERQLRQAQKMESVGQLTGGIAHDFNNILTVILGTLDVIGPRAANHPQIAEGLKAIEAASERAAALTRHLLAFARKQPLRPRRIDVNGLVRENVGLLAQTLGEQVEIVAQPAGGELPVSVDPSQLANALLNIAINARDAMPAGGKLIVETLEVRLDEHYADANPDVRPGRYVLVAVSDTGSGMPPAVLDRVFDPFFTTKEEGKGTGLGLSMVFGFVKQSGGHIKIYSELGHGTTVKIYLPFAADTASEVAADAGETPLGSRSKTILVVEDDELVRTSVVSRLRALEYDVVEATSGPAALDLVRSGLAFDLLFTDMVMPGGMSGKQLAEEIRVLRPDLRVLFTSGYTENAITHNGRLDPGVLLLNKPYRLAELAQKVREALSR